MLLTALVARPLASGEASAAREPEPPVRVDPGQLKPATFAWLIGIGDPKGAVKMIETIFASTYQGREVWRVVHRADDPTEKEFEFDMYDVDKATLAPVRTVYKADQFYLGLSFHGGKVKIEDRQGNKLSHSEVDVPANVMPAEGPGANLFLASLPLRAGYTARFRVVDRWAPDETQRVRLMKCSVQGSERITTGAGQYETMVVVVEPADGSKGSVSKSWVLAAAPHYSLRTEYAPRPGELKLSEVTGLLLPR